MHSIRLGQLELTNEFVVAPMTTYSSHDDGIIADDELDYLARRGEGGFGTIITAACYVTPAGKAFKGQWGCDAENKLDSMRRVVETIHRSGAKAILQIHHGGRQCPPELAGGECVSASAIPAEREGAPVPREMTDEEIERTIDAYADATTRAKYVGFDAVEIHGANTYLVQQFVSPHSNRRTDRWNADDLLFPIELTKRVLAAGYDLPIGYRFSPEEPETTGIRLDRTFRLLDKLCELPLSYLHISLRQYWQPSLHDANSEPVLKTVHDYLDGRLPLMGVGSVKSIADVEAIKKLGCEAVVLGRGAIYDPDWVKKYQRATEPERVLNRADFESQVVLPKGLSERIRNVAGWFDFAGEPS